MRLRLVRAHRWRPVAQVAADVARRWNNLHRPRCKLDSVLITN